MKKNLLMVLGAVLLLYLLPLVLPRESTALAEELPAPLQTIPPLSPSPSPIPGQEEEASVPPRCSASGSGPETKCWSSLWRTT